MSGRHNLLLVAVLGVLLALYFGSDYLAQREVAVQTAAEMVYPEISAEQLATITIAQRGAVPVSAVRDDDGAWQLTAPDPSIVPNSLLWPRVAAAIAGLTNKRTLDDLSQPAAAYGLEPPLLQVDAATAAGETIALRFGDAEPTGAHHYATADGGPVFLVPQASFFELNRTLSELRNPYLFDLAQETVTRLEIARYYTGRGAPPGEPTPEIGTELVNMIFVRDGGDAPWRMEQPIPGLANQDAVNQFVQELQFATGRDYIDAPEGLADYGLDPAFAKLTLASGIDGRRQSVLLGGAQLSQSKEAGLYAKLPERPAVFVIDPHVLTMLPKSVEEMRDKRMLQRRAEGLRQLDYRGPEGTFTLSFDADAGWQVTAPSGIDADNVKISEYIAALASFSAARFLAPDEAASELDPPRAEWTLRYDDGTDASIKIGGPTGDDGTLAFAEQSSGARVTVAANTAAQLMTSAERFRSDVLVRLLPNEVEGITLTLDGQTYRLRRDAGRWRMTEPVAGILPNQADGNLLLRALSLVPLSGPATPTAIAPEHGLDAPVLRAEFELLPTAEGGDPRFAGPLLVGAPAEDNAQDRWASYAERTGAYRIAQPWLSRIRELVSVLAPGAGGVPAAENP